MLNRPVLSVGIAACVALSVPFATPQAEAAQPEWTLLSSTLTSRSGHATAFDPNLNKIVLFGGGSNGASSETWTFDGTAWAYQQTETSPPPRRQHAMAYDPNTQRVILFGGDTRANGVLHGDTWAFDGEDWSLVATTGPSARESHAMTFDASLNRVVLYGGQTAGGISDETWAWDGNAWEPLAVSGPGPRAGHAMAYDPQRQATVLHGGHVSGNFATGFQSLGDTWVLTGSGWASLTSQGPSPRTYHAMEFDQNSQQLVMVGGSSIGDSWTLNGDVWEPLATSNPNGRGGHTLSFDPIRNQLVLFGGSTDEFGVEPGVTWVWKDQEWAAVPGSTPERRQITSLVYDATQSELLVLGGNSSAAIWSFDGQAWDGWIPQGPSGTRYSFYDTQAQQLVAVSEGQQPHDGSAPGDLWTFDGTVWSLQSADPPSIGSIQSAVFDSSRNERIMLTNSAFSENSIPISTWKWVAGGWQLVATPEQTPSVIGFATAFDAARGEILLFGGDHTPIGPDENYSNETWAWNGTEWALRAATGPSPRENSTMAFDEQLGKVFLFGGRTGTGPSTETWSWDGAQWTLENADGPDVRYQSSMAYDAEAQTVVLYDGNTNQIWAWNGSAWDRNYTPPLRARTAHTLTEDTARNQLVLFGGRDRSVSRAETWVFDGESWNAVLGAQPPALTWHAAAFDGAREDLVLFGGIEDGEIAGQTWTFDGTNWQHASVAGPSPRYRHAMAYDPIAEETILFGGLITFSGVTNIHSGETWAWNGSGWTLKATTGPTPREGFAMAFDPIHNEIVLFGGADTVFPANARHDTWAWNGSAWEPRATEGPTLLYRPKVAFDPSLQQLVMVGEEVFQSVAGTWAWDGSAWNPLPTTGPSPRSGHAMATDSAHNRVILYGGETGAGIAADTWALAQFCAADITGDGTVDNDDIGVFVQFFLSGNLAADFNGDGFLDHGDIGAFVQAFLGGC
ncbi:MAG: hypothetical protein ACI89L_000621 [Phycisphaerales bacterium]|jgi:hypothetical protein